jgi:hypothetical protein
VVATFLNSFVNHAHILKMANMAQLVNVIAPIFASLQHLGFVAHGGHLRGARRAAVGHLQRSAAVHADLAGRAADSHSRPDRSRRLERTPLRIAQQYALAGTTTRTCGARSARSRQPHGHSLDGHRASAWAPSFRSVTGRPISWSCSGCFPPKILRAAKMAPVIGAGFKMLVPFIVILPGLLALAVLPRNWSARRRGGDRRPQL